MLKKIFLVIFSLVFAQNMLMAQDKVLDDLYLTNLQKTIELNWISALVDDNKNDVLAFSLDRNGSVFDVKVVRSSGDDEFDRSTIMAVYKAAPFKEFPQCVDKDAVDFKIYFSKNLISLDIVDKNAYQCAEKNEIYNQTIDGVNYGYYLNNMDQRVVSHWNVPYYSQNKLAVALFSVKDDGSVYDLHIVKSSEDKKFDNEAIKAIRASIPFDSFPRASEKDSIKVQFVFSYDAMKIYKTGKADTTCILADTNLVLIKDYEDYKKQINTVLSNNLPKKGYHGEKDALLKITIDRSGKISYIGIETSSGDKNFDNQILKSLKLASFPAIPSILNKKDFSLEYYVRTVVDHSQRNFAGNCLDLWARKLFGVCIW